jgi:hypothetical protein
MSTLPSLAQCLIIAAWVLLSPVLAFLMAIAAAGLLGLLKDAGITASLATVVGCTIAYLLVRRLRAVSSANRVNST